ncbi:MAG: ABC transporter ATP-binding protein [Chloroflexi bacterium]|jgi:oligopeptide/dipeptide ABC transporter ATP-binding protein|nr:ABC transporter ATP-binding protein [Chloroflexota bacterium]
MNATPLLEARNVTKVFASRGTIGARGTTTVAVNQASLAIHATPPSIVAIAGESGSGKTTLSRLLLGLISPTSGEVFYRGRPMEAIKGAERMAFRRDVQAIFQDPFEVYNPFYRVDHALEVPIRRFEPHKSAAERRALIEQALDVVGLRVDETLGRYPHQLSGGQRQRVMVARALMLNPSIIVADEPVSMVDASLRASILESLLNAHDQRDIAIIYITHDLTTAYQVCTSILMMYSGAMVEVGSVEPVIKDPLHPYTQLLVGSIPLPDPTRRWAAVQASSSAAGQHSTTQGCPYAPRCPQVMDICRTEAPPLYAVSANRAVACYLYRGAPAVATEDVSALYIGA